MPDTTNESRDDNLSANSDSEPITELTQQSTSVGISSEATLDGKTMANTKTTSTLLTENDVIFEDEMEYEDEPPSALTSIPVDAQLANVKVDDKQTAVNQVADLMFSKSFSDLFNLSTKDKGTLTPYEVQVQCAFN